MHHSKLNILKIRMKHDFLKNTLTSRDEKIVHLGTNKHGRNENIGLEITPNAVPCLDNFTTEF